MDIDKNRYLNKKVEFNGKSNRDYLISLFIEPVNNHLEKGGYKRKPASYFGYKLSTVPTQDLYFFFKKCENSESFGRTFFGSLKVKK